MRTAHIIRRFAFSEWGGTESVVWNTARTLQAKGNPSEIFATRALSPVADEVKNAIQIHRFEYKYPHFPLSKAKRLILDKKGGNPVVYGLEKALKKGEFDILHCHTMGRMAASVRNVSRKMHIPYVMTLHGGYFDVPPAEIKQMVKPLKGTIPYGNIMDRLLGRKIDTGDSTEYLTVPAAALIDEGGKTYVYTGYDEEKDELLGLTEITTGLSDGENVEILSGISAGDKVCYRYADTIEYSFMR